jgi:hypothetical protein
MRVGGCNDYALVSTGIVPLYTSGEEWSSLCRSVQARCRTYTYGVLFMNKGVVQALMVVPPVVVLVLLCLLESTDRLWQVCLLVVGTVG